MQQQQSQKPQDPTKKGVPKPERKTFQFHEFQEEEVVTMPIKESATVIPKPKPTGPWSDDLIEDVDDPSWTTVTRKKRKTK
jgi:hypothetical protein